MPANLPDLTSSAPDLSTNPVVIYAAVAVAVALALGTLTDKGLGPLSRWWFDFAKRRRESTVRREASDLTEMRRQITNLSGLLEANNVRTTDLENFVVAYVQWGFVVRAIAGEKGIPLPEPPQLHT